MTKITGDSQKAIEFLKLVQPIGPWALTAIEINRKAIQTETFRPDQEKECRAFIDKYNGERNIYWHVNPVRHHVSKKAEREDIAQVIQLHVDIDPRAGEDVETEKTRILGVLQNPPQNIPPPSTIVFSGGGYQAFWTLSTPIPINGDLALAEEAKLYNMQLERAFGADNCHNIDRLMRLVGSVNVPDAKKKKKGRTAIVSTLVEHHPDRIYGIEQFKKATIVQMKDDAGFSSGSSVQISGNIERIMIEDLDQWAVPDRVRVIIVQGHHPDEPKEKDNSRSAWVFDCICQLVRAQVPDDVIYSILTDPDFRISDSVLEKGANAEKYAIRQIERAKEWVIEPWLRTLNETHAVIENLGGKCRVIEEVMDHALGRTKLTKQSFDDFRNRYMHKRVQIGTDKDGGAVYERVGKWWLQNEMRRQYKTIVFAPGSDIPGCYNLWKGYGCEAKEGDCSLFLEHIKKNLCSGNEDYFNYMIGWMANCIQNPDSPGQVAIVLRSGMGTGKGFFAKHFGSLFGRHYMQIGDAKHLVGNFNAHLRDCVLLFGDEAFYAGDKKHEGILKMLITEDTITVEAKGIDAETSPNYVHLIMASNNQWVVPAGADERRFFMLDVAEDHKQDIHYFARIAKQMDEGGREALLHMLLNYDLSNFEVRKMPKTAALQEQKLFSMSPEQEWWYVKLEEGRLLKNHEKWECEVIKDALFDDYVDYMRKYNVMRRANRTALGRFLTKFTPHLATMQKSVQMQELGGDGIVRDVTRRPYFYKFPTLEECRKKWTEKFGSENWPSIEESQQPELHEKDKNEVPF